MAFDQVSTTQVAVGTDSLYVRGLMYDGWRWSAPGDPNVIHWAVDATWTPLQVQTLTGMFGTWAAVSRITFQQVENRFDAEIVFHQMDLQDIGAPGRSGSPGPGIGQVRTELAATYLGNPYSYTFVPNPDTTDTVNPTIISNRGFELILHEVGHALGLKHPHDSPVLFPGVINGSIGSNGLNQTLYTVMSYNHWHDRSVEEFAQATPMAFDIAAIQRLYGANTTARAGNDTYVLPDPGSGPMWQCIWDTGGTDEIVYNGSVSAVIDLRPATLDDSPTGGGLRSYSFITNTDMVDGVPTQSLGRGFTIAGDYTSALPDQQGVTGVIIENARGGSGNDEITGNDADNELRGGAGNDTLDGEGGNDLLRGSAGIDLLLGDGGSDTFFYGTGDGLDTVADFSRAGGDKIDFTLFAGIASFHDIISRAIQVMLDTVIDFGNGDRLTLTNVEMTSLADSDFVLSTVSPAVVLESFGSTSLVQSGNSYFMPPAGGPSGPQLMRGGAPVVPGQSGAWTPIGAEAAETGYLIAWKNGAADEYTVWNTDSNGNYLWDPIGTVSGSSMVLESYEPVFQQDLNSDGHVGAETTIEAFGVTWLVQVGDGFVLQDSAGSGPSLKAEAAAIVAGQFGAWTPIGAEAAETGYLIAWKNGAADEYTVWNTDSNGSYLWDPIGTVSGSSMVLELYEPVFQQDLNSDGHVGAEATIEAFGVTWLVQVGDGFVLQDSAGNGPSLKAEAAAIVAGQFGAWTPIGAEAAETGYLIAWKNGAADEYTVWNTDGNGSYLWDPIGTVSGSSVVLELYEPVFQQDLNSNGTIGVTDWLM